MTPDELANALIGGTLSPGEFRHADHLAAAYSMLNRYSFAEALWRYSEGIEALADKAGAPKKYNVTITVSFMSLVAEHMSDSDTESFEDFIEANPELLESDLLLRWYTKPVLASDLARRTFILPDRGTRTESGPV